VKEDDRELCTGFDYLPQDHRTIRSIKLMVSAMLSAATKRKYNSVFSLLHHCLPAFDEIYGIAMNFVFFFIEVTLIKIANTPLDMSAV